MQTVEIEKEKTSGCGTNQLIFLHPFLLKLTRFTTNAKGLRGFSFANLKVVQIPNNSAKCYVSKKAAFETCNLAKHKSYMCLTAELREQGKEKRRHKRLVTLRLSLPGGV